MKRILMIFILLALKYTFGQESHDWSKYGEARELFESVYQGQFGLIENDLYFKTLFLSYVNYMSTNCPDFLPEDRIEYDVEISGMEEVYSHTLYTGIGSMPFLNMYNTERTTRTETLYIDPRFKTVADWYTTESFAQEFVLTMLMDYERLGNMSVYMVRLFKNLNCGSEVRKRFGENLLRFANNEEPFYTEKPKVFEKPDPLPVHATMADMPPIFPGCENLEKYEASSCFTKMLIQHVKDNFYYPEELKNIKVGGRVNVSFNISEEGKVRVVDARRYRERNNELENVAIKIIEKLPVMKPAFHNGEIVKSRYSIPILFR